MKSLHLDIKNMFLDLLDKKQHRHNLTLLHNVNDRLFDTHELTMVYDLQKIHQNAILLLDIPIVYVSYKDGRREIVDRPIFDDMIVGPLRGI